MEPANSTSRTRDASWPLCGRNHHPLGRRARARPRSIKQERPRSTFSAEPSFFQQLETLKGAVGELSRSLEQSGARTTRSTSLPTPPSITPPKEKTASISVAVPLESSPTEPSLDAMPNVMFPLHRNSVASAHPSQSAEHTSALWQQYLSKVDPLLKILDVTTIQHLFISDIAPNNIPKDLAGLKSAVLFAAATSIQQPCDIASPISDHFTKTYAREVEAFLAESRFLAEPTMTAIQALAIYLACGKRVLSQTYAWSLTGVLVRLAMLLKLHRDPDGQGLPFSNCEYRRRLWWVICSLDAHTSEANNTDPMIYERQCTTRVPEWSTDPACPAYLADMLYSAVRSEITSYSRTILFSDLFTQDNGFPVLPTDGKLCIVAALEDALKEKYFNRCDRNLPIYKLALTSSKITIARLKLAVLNQNSEIQAHKKREGEQILRSCVDVMEGLRSFRADPALSTWAWLWQSYADWDAANICLSVLCRDIRCSSGVLSRAWSAVEAFFDSWTDSYFEPTRQEQWARLNHLRAQAEVPHPFTSSKRKSRHSKAFTLTDSRTEDMQRPSIADARRSLTLPIDLAKGNAGDGSHRRNLHGGGDSFNRNWSLPMSSPTHEVHRDRKGSDPSGLNCRE